MKRAHKKVHIVRKRLHHPVHVVHHAKTALKEAKTERKEVLKSYFVKLDSKHLPFAVMGANFEKVEKSEKVLQEFIKLLEKKFDAIWYIGADYFDNEIYERFIFHNGGFMEVSINGRVKCFFAEDKIGKMKEAIFYANKKLGSENLAKNLGREIKSGQKLISLRDSILKEVMKR